MDASVSLIPLSIIQKLGIGKVSEMGTNLKFSDHNMKKSYGVAEYVLLEIDTFIFLDDFEIMDILEDEETLILLGRPFLLTSRCNIDIKRGTLTMKYFGEEITLKVVDIKKQGVGEDNQSSVCMTKIEEESKIENHLQKKSQS